MKRRPLTKAELVARMVNAQSWNGKLDAEEQQHMGLFMWISFDWAKRQPSKAAIMNIISVCNLALVLANRGYPRAYSGECNQAFAIVLAGLKQVISRGKDANAWSLNGDLIRHIPEIMSLHEEQLAEVSRKEMEACVNFVRDNV